MSNPFSVLNQQVLLNSNLAAAGWLPWLATLARFWLKWILDKNSKIHLSDTTSVA